MHRLLGVDCFDAIRLRRDLVLRDDSGNHRRRLRRRVSGWVRTDGKWTFLSLCFLCVNFLLLGRRVYVVGLETKTSQTHRE